MSAPGLSSIADYGLPVADYLIEVTDPSTDQPAAGANQLGCDVAMMSRCAVRAVVTMLTNSTSTPTVSASESQWGATAPTVARTGTGVYTVTWPATVTDELGETQSVNIRFALHALGEWDMAGAGYAVVARAAVTSANVVTVKACDPSGVPVDSASLPITIAVL